jgi:hypothetical protein
MSEETNESEGKAMEQAAHPMEVPDNFLYANSMRVYSGAGDCMIEFGRALPPSTPGAPVSSVPVIGIVIPAVVAVHLAKQLLTQAALLAPQMVEMKEMIISEMSKGNVGTAS